MIIILLFPFTPKEEKLSDNTSQTEDIVDAVEENSPEELDASESEDASKD